MIEYKINSKGHKWMRYKNKIDFFAYNPFDPHNGPRCSVCGYGFCHHCQEEPEISCEEYQRKKRIENMGTAV